MSPSIDRIDNDGGYIIDNLQFLHQGVNIVKDKKVPLSLYRYGNYIGKFDSIHSCAKFINLNVVTVFNWLRKGTKSKDGYTVKELP